MACLRDVFFSLDGIACILGEVRRSFLSLFLSPDTPLISDQGLCSLASAGCGPDLTALSMNGVDGFSVSFPPFSVYIGVHRVIFVVSHYP